LPRFCGCGGHVVDHRPCPKGRVNQRPSVESVHDDGVVASAPRCHLAVDAVALPHAAAAADHAQLVRFVAQAEDGRGVYLMRTLVDDLSYERVNDRTHVKLTKRWPHVHEAITTLDGQRASDLSSEACGR
jgi:hypothetical protein